MTIKILPKLGTYQGIKRSFVLILYFSRLSLFRSFKSSYLLKGRKLASLCQISIKLNILIVISYFCSDLYYLASVKRSFRLVNLHISFMLQHCYYMFYICTYLISSMDVVNHTKHFCTVDTYAAEC